jgi:hypothetical protein
MHWPLPVHSVWERQEEEERGKRRRRRRRRGGGVRMKLVL